MIAGFGAGLIEKDSVSPRLLTVGCAGLFVSSAESRVHRCLNWVVGDSGMDWGSVLQELGWLGEQVPWACAWGPDADHSHFLTQGTKPTSWILGEAGRVVVRSYFLK